MTTGSGTADGNIAIAGSIIGTDTSTGAGNTTNLSLTSGDGTIDIHAINTDIEDVTIAGNTTLGGTITLTNSGVFDLTGDVLVDVATLEINSSAGGGGNVTISGALASKTAAGKNVDILTGAGLTTIGGNIGTGANGALGTLDINATAGAGGVTLSGNIGTGLSLIHI